jgi:hypothetical protein
MVDNIDDKYEEIGELEKGKYKPVYVRLEKDEGIRYVIGHTRGEEVSAETYKVYVDDSLPEEDLNLIKDFASKRSGSTFVLWLHMEDIYVKKES